MTIDDLRRLAETRYRSGDLFGAEEAMRQLVGSTASPSLADVLTLARLNIDLMNFQKAEELLDHLLGQAPHAPPVVRSAAKLYASQGKQEKAATLLCAALEQHPEDPPLLALALTYLDEPDDALIQTAERVAARLPDDTDRKTSLLYPLARILDRSGDYERAWETMTRANELSRRRRGGAAAVEPDALYQQLSGRIRRAIDIAESLPAAEPGEMDFVFMTGAPRTGGSLLQTVLSAHDGVASVGERAALLDPLLAMCDSPGEAPPPARMAELARADVAGLERQGHRDGMVVDKAPHNFYVAPLLRAVHGGAAIVNLLRDPRDVALSMLFHDFPPAYPEATELAGIERMLMARAEGALEYRDRNINVLTVSFEAFLEDPDAEGRRIAEFAGITWDPRALAAERRDAVVSTFSAGQVRKEIAPPAKRWQRFEAQLAEFAPAFQAIAELQRELVAVGTDL